MQLALVIMAAGMGSRYGGLKQMEGFGPSGETLLEYGIADAQAAGFEQFVFVIRREIEAAFREIVLSRFAERIDYQLVFQESDALPDEVQAAARTRPWGTGHAVWVARNAVNSPFAVINADDYYGTSAYKVMADYLRDTDETSRVPCHAMVGYRLDQTLSEQGTVSRGVCQVDAEGYLEAIEEWTELRAAGGGVVGKNAAGVEGKLSGKERVSLNLWGFLPDFFADLDRELKLFLQQYGQDSDKEFYLPAVVDAALDKGEARVRVLSSEDPWYGVTYPADRDSVRRALKHRGPLGFCQSLA